VGFCLLLKPPHLVVLRHEPVALYRDSLKAAERKAPSGSSGRRVGWRRRRLEPLFWVESTLSHLPLLSTGKACQGYVSSNLFGVLSPAATVLH
jgi:hypothetical protein